MTYASRERSAKLLLAKLLKAEAGRWRRRTAQILRARPTVAARIEASLVDDALLGIDQAQAWLETATIPRRVR